VTRKGACARTILARMRRPSFPTVISLIALFVALGGTSYAVIKLPAKSVGNRELKSNAVTSSKIRPRSVGRSDLAVSARVGSRGPRGATGPTGPAGAPGSAAVEPWKALTFVGSWTNYGAPYSTGAYRKDASGKVHLRGLLAKGAGVPVSGDVMAILPPGYRPTMRYLFGAGGGAPTELYTRVDVLPNGEITFMAGATADGDFTSLDNISFWTD
jgi:hypothetical protein